MVIGQNLDLRWEWGSVGKWVWPKGAIYHFRGGRGRDVWQITRGSYSRLQIPLRHSELSFSQQHFSFKDILLLPHVRTSKICLQNRYFEQQIHLVPLLLHKSLPVKRAKKRCDIKQQHSKQAKTGEVERNYKIFAYPVFINLGRPSTF